MYWLGLILTLLVVPVTAAIPVWAAWQLAQSSITGKPTAAWDVALPDLILAVFTTGIVLWKFAAPVLARETWAAQPASAFIFGVTWMGSVIACSGLVLLCGADPLKGLSRTNSQLVFVSSWFAFDAITSWLPAALMRKALWGRAQAHGDTGAGPAAAPLRSRDKDDLLYLVQRLAVQGPGYVEDGVFIEPDGGIITSQAALARLLHISKSTVNKYLNVLRAEDRIEFFTSSRDTEIRVRG